MKDIFATLDGRFKVYRLVLIFLCALVCFVCVYFVSLRFVCMSVCVCASLCKMLFVVLCTPCFKFCLLYLAHAHTHTHTFARVDPHAHTYLHSLAKYCSTQTSLQIFRHTNDKASLAMLLHNF